MSEFFPSFNEVDESGDVTVPDGMPTNVHYAAPDESEYAGHRPTIDFGRWDVESNETTEENVEAEEIPEMDRAARLMQSKDLNGFYPQEPAELVQLTALSSDTYKVGGAAKYLNEILTFRKKHEEAHKNDEKPYDPAAALRTIVRDWDGYVKNSRAELSALLLLKDELADPNIQPFTGLENVSGIADWKYQGITHRAIGALTREYETQQFVEEKGPDYLGTHYATDDKDIIEREASLAKNLRVREARQRTNALIEAHRNRIEYWKARVEEATAQLAVRAIARQALENYK